MVGGGEIVMPRDHLEKRHPRGVAYTDDVIPLLLGAADEDELLLAHLQDPGPDLVEHLHRARAIALVGLAPAQVLLRLGPAGPRGRIGPRPAPVDYHARP